MLPAAQPLPAAPPPLNRAAPPPLNIEIPDPKIEIRPGEIEYRWITLDRYRQDYRSTLRYRGLFVVDSGTLQAQATIRVLLRTPTGELIRCTGEVVNVSPAGAAIQFTVTADDAARLAAAAG